MGNMELSELNLVGNPIKEVPRSFKNLSRNCTFVVSKKMPEETLRQFKQICGTDRLRYKENISIRRGR
jgi:hypothetical protein